MADPQHPDIAAPTLAQMPALIAKHDEFAALAAEHGHDEMAALHAVTAAALRTLTRPVEDEEVRATDAFLVWLGRSYPLARNDAKQLEKAQDILARLAREKASAEQERDAAIALMAEELEEANARAAKDRKLAAAWLCDKLKAQTDLAVAREALAEIEVELGGSLHRAGIREIARRALAAAAGAEEPR